MSLLKQFVKYQSLGNDFIIFDWYKKPALFVQVELSGGHFSSVVQRLCDRHFGVGADGVLVITSHQEFGFPVVTIYNADGSKAESCLNGLRCVADYLFTEYYAPAPPELVEGRPVRGERADLPLLKQLYWRDFFTHVAHFSPHVFGHAFNQHYEHIKWQGNMHHFKRWCQGMTGFPIVDAGMRQLNATGWMHNRVRMIVASFLVKDLHIDWRMGEQYFAIKLVDYDPAVNNGNWQWAASTGCDAQPYFRIFNPWLQQQKFDPTCAYIKQWVPELAKLSPAHIHTWDKTAVQPAKPYPKPMVDHAVVSKEAIALFKKYEK